MAKIKRFKNGDTCPCCGQVIRGLTDEQLDLFSVRIAAIGFEADLDPMFPEIDGDFLMVTLDDLSRALEEWRLEMEAGDDEPPAETRLVEANIYDEVEVHKDVTVQILRNSVTGETSFGWWEEEKT